jgi:dephospho-CoA kinase
LDRAAMRDRVFSDPAARKILEAILHPLIRAESIRRLLERRYGPYALLVVPLLVENLAAYRPLLHRIALVDCEAADQLQRTAARPGVGIEQARAILAAQASPAERMRIADDVIDNRGDLAGLRHQVGLLHERYLELAGSDFEQDLKQFIALNRGNPAKSLPIQALALNFSSNSSD